MKEREVRYAVMRRNGDDPPSQETIRTDRRAAEEDVRLLRDVCRKPVYIDEVHTR